MTSDSKIRHFLFIVALVFFLSSCNKKNDVIPDVIVDFSLSLNDPQFIDLRSFGTTVLIDANTNNLGIRAAGYDGNGIIIFSGVNEYYAYDRTCPHDYVIDGSSIRVNVDPENSLNAICPKCSTNYALSAGGTPSKGVGQYPLKNYRTSFDGLNVRVWNN